jgi:hypothetical protein
MTAFLAKTAAKKLLGKKLQEKFGKGVSAQFHHKHVPMYRAWIAKY